MFRNLFDQRHQPQCAIFGYIKIKSEQHDYPKQETVKDLHLPFNWAGTYPPETIELQLYSRLQIIASLQFR